jgi:3-phenylpropionate/cinnamic acid dioxygenase small subunit
MRRSEVDCGKPNMKIAEAYIPRYRSDRCLEHYLPASAAEHSEVYQFITFEALLLDHCRYRQWIRMLSADLHYHLVSGPTAIPESGPSLSQALVEHDYASICHRANELADSQLRESRSPAQLRRLITNLSVSSVVHGKF